MRLFYTTLHNVTKPTKKINIPVEKTTLGDVTSFDLEALKSQLLDNSRAAEETIEQSTEE